MYKVLVILLLVSSVCVAENSQYSDIEKGLKVYAEKVSRLKQTIDNSVFQDQELLLELEFDTEQLISFVKNKIAFQPYQGLLRGVQGTLNSRSGNALDQSVLLAKLLNDAGLDARIATAQLSTQQSLQLLSGMANPEIPQHIGEGADFEQALRTFNSKKQDKVDWQKTTTFARYKKTLGALSAVLDKHQITLHEIDMTQRLVEASKAYFWVQYRSNPTDEWHAAHPAFSQPVNFQLKALSHFQNTVPVQYHHQLKIEAFIEQRVGDEIKKHSLMEPWIKPVANLQDKLITFSNAPSGVDVKADYDLSEILDKSDYFIPIFNGNKVGDKVFDLKGRLIDTGAMSTPAGALFQTLGDKTLTAVDKLADEGGERADGRASMQLTSQWLKFTFIYPDGTEFVQKRYLYQAPKSGQIEDLDVKTKLITEYNLLASSGEKTNAYLAQVFVDLVESGLPLLSASAKKVFNPQQQVAFPKQIIANEFELLSQYHWMQQNPEQNKSTIQFRSQASLLGFKRGYVNPETAFLSVDVIANKQTFIRQQDGKFFTDPQSALVQGVWETACEWIPSQILGIAGNSLDTLKVTEASLKQRIDFKVYQPTEQDQMQLNTDLNENTVLLDRVSADIKQGYVVAIPVQKPNGLGMTGWWRINPESGETLGMIGDGGGSEITEYLIENTQIALTLARAVNNLKKCDEKTNDLEKLCCLAETHFNNVGGLAFGGVLGAALGTAGAALFDIVDFTAEYHSGNGIAPSTGGKLCAGIDFPEF